MFCFFSARQEKQKHALCVYTDNRKKHTALYRLQVVVSFALELSGFLLL